MVTKAQQALDVLSPFGSVTLIRDPTLYNLMAAITVPASFGVSVYLIERFLVTLPNPMTPHHVVAHKVNNLYQGGKFAARAAPVVGLVATEAVLAHELYGGMTKNMAMESIDSVPGAVTHPFEGGSSEVYYPGKSIVDWVMSW